MKSLTSSQPPSAVGANIGRVIPNDRRPSGVPRIGDIEEKAYVPKDVAREKIKGIAVDMELMKNKHVKSMEELDDAYRRVESHTESHYIEFIRDLRRSAAARIAQYKLLVTETRKQNDTYREQVESKLAAVDDEIAELKATHKAELKSVNDTHRADIKSREESLAALKAAHAEQLEEMNNVVAATRAAGSETEAEAGKRFSELEMTLKSTQAERDTALAEREQANAQIAELAAALEAAQAAGPASGGEAFAVERTLVAGSMPPESEVNDEDNEQTIQVREQVGSIERELKDFAEEEQEGLKRKEAVDAEINTWSIAFQEREGRLPTVEEEKEVSDLKARSADYARELEEIRASVNTLQEKKTTLEGELEVLEKKKEESLKNKSPRVSPRATAVLAAGAVATKPGFTASNAELDELKVKVKDLEDELAKVQGERDQSQTRAEEAHVEALRLQQALKTVVEQSELMKKRLDLRSGEDGEDGEVALLTQELAALRSSKTELAGECAELQAKNTSLNDKVASLEADVEALKASGGGGGGGGGGSPRAVVVAAAASDGGGDVSQQEFDALEEERDRWKDDFEKMTDDRDRWKRQCEDLTQSLTSMQANADEFDARLSASEAARNAAEIEVRVVRAELEAASVKAAAAPVAREPYVDKATYLKKPIQVGKSAVENGQKLWRARKKRECYGLYKKEATSIVGMLPDDDEVAVPLVDALTEASKGDSAASAQGALTLRRGLDAFLDAAQGKYLKLKAADRAGHAAEDAAPAATAVEDESSSAEAAEAAAKLAALREELLAAQSAKEAAEAASGAGESKSDDASEDRAASRTKSVPMAVHTAVAERAEAAERKVEELTEANTNLKDELATAKSEAAEAAAEAAEAAAAAASASAAAAGSSGGKAPAPVRQVVNKGLSKEEKKKYEKQIKELRASVRTAEKKAAKAEQDAKAAANNKDAERDLKIASKKLAEAEKKFKKEADEAAKKSDQKLAATEKAKKALEKQVGTLEDEVKSLKADRDKWKAKASDMGAMEKQMEDLRAQAGEAKTAKKEAKEAVEQMTKLDKLYRDEQILRKRYYNMMEDMKGKIRVYCRCRPMSKSEKERGNFSVVSFPDEVTVKLGEKGDGREFVYDQCFGPTSTQTQVFEDTENLIQSAFDGFNVCIFAYGQTGSGKTFTMTGAPDHPGVTPRAIGTLFGLIDRNKGVCRCKISVYMVELYNDGLVDLLHIVDKGKKAPQGKLDIKKNNKGMVFVQGVVIKDCASGAEVLDLFEKGNNSRHVGATKMNAESSRSHLVFSILIESYNKQTKKTSTGKLSLVDLAGSERVGKTGASADRLKEAQSINKSLSALGNVISALSTGEKFIPYRNNKLTQLMSDSLGGNAKTLMFVNVSPADYNTDETMSSLVYASRVKLIKNNANKNSDSEEVAKLKARISELQAAVGGGGGGGSG